MEITTEDALAIISAVREHLYHHGLGEFHEEAIVRISDQNSR